ncbi:NADPH-dependent ferric siderophore reductase [Dietzia sp. 2505]|uniref:siderophore-interacting protein n=1 Tax=Dietzia sp. 2505 TaxID=3156457 RepID=UPI003399F59D
MSRPELLIHPLVVRTVRVAEVEDLAGRVRRVHLEGEQLQAFTRDGVSHPAFHAPGFDDHIKVIFAADGDIDSALPRQHADGIEWTPSENRLTRDYTPHSVAPDSGAFAVDFVLHGDGPAARWAADAVPGTELSFVGPKSSQLLPKDATSIVMIGDETALPAIRRFLTERPLAVPAHVVVLTAGRTVAVELPVRSTDSLRREFMLEPDGEVIGALFDAVDDEYDLGERPFVWAAGEAGALLPLRRRLGGRVGRGYRNITGYWYLVDEHGATMGEPGLPEAPVAWFAVRAALQLGLLRSLADRPLSTSELESAVDARTDLRPLVEVLATSGLVRACAKNRWELTDLAVDLLDDPHEVEEFTGPEADLAIALRHLARSVRTGRPAWELDTGLGFAESSKADAEVAGYLEHQADSLVYLQHGLIRVLGDLRSPDTVVVGPGAALVAGVATENGLTNVRSSDGETSAALVVSAMLLGHLDDESARSHLHGLAAIAPRLVVVDGSTPDGLSSAAAQLALLRFSTTASPPRSPRRVAELGLDSGWTLRSHHGLGWGVVAYEFELTADYPSAR